MIPRFEPTASLGEILGFLSDCIRAKPDDGVAVGEFERRFEEYQGCEHAVFVPSGRIALWLLLKGLNCPEGSEIVIPAFTFFAIPAVIRLAGMVPVHAEIGADTYVLSPDSVAAAITENTRAVIPTHLFGRTCDLAGLEEICRPRNVDIIEDCAQSFGARVGGARSGSVGRASYFTFGITKNFTTFSGGMLVCRDPGVNERVRDLIAEFGHVQNNRLVKQGLTALAMRMGSYRVLFNMSAAPLLRFARSKGPDIIHRAFEERPGAMRVGSLQSRMWRPGHMQARAGMRQLESLDAKNEERRKHGAKLLRFLEHRGCGGLPAPAAGSGDHIYMSFAIRRPDRYRYIAALRKQQVDSSPGYMSDCSGFKALGGRPGRCPVSEQVDREIVHIPLYPGLSDRDLVRIADAVAAADRRLKIFNS